MNMSSLMDRLPYRKLLIFYCFTFVCRGQGTNQNTSANSNTTTPFKYTVDRHTTFNLGSDADLTCSDKTLNQTIYVIWTIDLKYKDCKISFSNDGRSIDSCNDGKSLQSTSSDKSYLHIPNFSNDDVGIYKCEIAYRGGGETYKIDVSVTVPPTISAWLERKDNMVVAVCIAERGKPAASITWSHMENSTAGEHVIDSNGFFTVESRLEFLEGMNPENLSCVIRHPYWREEKILVPEHRKGGRSSPTPHHPNHHRWRKWSPTPTLKDCSAIYWWRSEHCPAS